VWQKRQEMPSQWATTGPALIERIERTNAVVVRGQGQRMRAPRRDFYAMEVDWRRNCYACRRFRHIVHHYRNQGRGRVAESRRLEYREERIKGNYEQLSNLKEVENLESLD